VLYQPARENLDYASDAISFIGGEVYSQKADWRVGKLRRKLV